MDAGDDPPESVAALLYVIGDDATTDPALLVPGAPERRYDADRLVATVYRTANLLRHCGVHAGATVAVTDRRDPEALVALLGAALLGARVRVGGFDSRPADADPRPADADSGPADAAPLPTATPFPDGTRAVLRHGDDPEPAAHATERPSSASVLVYGDAPDDPAVTHFERAVWSENPAFPAATAAGGESVLFAVADGHAGHLVDDDRPVTQRHLLTAARAAAEQWSLAPGDRVAVRSSLAHPGTVAGALAALVAGGTVVLVGERSEPSTYDAAVADTEPPESTWSSPAALLRDAGTNRK